MTAILTRLARLLAGYLVDSGLAAELLGWVLAHLRDAAQDAGGGVTPETVAAVRRAMAKPGRAELLAAQLRRRLRQGPPKAEGKAA